MPAPDPRLPSQCPTRTEAVYAVPRPRHKSIFPSSFDSPAFQCATCRRPARPATARRTRCARSGAQVRLGAPPLVAHLGNPPPWPVPVHRGGVATRARRVSLLCRRTLNDGNWPALEFLRDRTAHSASAEPRTERHEDSPRRANGLTRWALSSQCSRAPGPRYRCRPAATCSAARPFRSVGDTVAFFGHRRAT